MRTFKKFYKLLSVIFLVILFIFIFSNKKLPNSSANKFQTFNQNYEIKILLVGDIMLDRYVERKILINGGDYSFPFKKIVDYLKSFDYVVANLEGPITTKGSKVGGIYSFRMKPIVAKTLKDSNIKIVNLANNHIFDYGKIGFQETLKYLEKNGVKYFGTSYEPLILEIRNTRIGFLGFSDFLKHLGIKENNNGIAIINNNLDEIIKKAKEKVDVLIVSFHWGDEYKKIANERQRKFAKLAIDSGADLVIGHHPHVIQNIEKYKDKFIFYSLGNFIFDQNFSQETMVGGGVEVIIKNKKIENIYFRKFYLNKDFQIEKISEQFLLYEIENKVYLLLIADEPEEWERGLMFVKKRQNYTEQTQSLQNLQNNSAGSASVQRSSESENNSASSASVQYSSTSSALVQYSSVVADGMIFIFPDKQIRTFWNKNTFVDLDIYWLDGDKIIGKDFLPSIEKTKQIYTLTSPAPVNKVIEIIK